MKITKKTKLNEIVEKNPKAGEILFDAGMMCVGCAMAQEETLEQGCLAHGMSKKDMDKLVEKLNRK
jgi:hybrid cluster-associated redox disulfide protein